MLRETRLETNLLRATARTASEGCSFAKIQLVPESWTQTANCLAFYCTAIIGRDAYSLRTQFTSHSTCTFGQLAVCFFAGMINMQNAGAHKKMLAYRCFANASHAPIDMRAQKEPPIWPLHLSEALCFRPVPRREHCVGRDSTLLLATGGTLEHFALAL